VIKTRIKFDPVQWPDHRAEIRRKTGFVL